MAAKKATKKTNTKKANVKVKVTKTVKPTKAVKTTKATKATKVAKTAKVTKIAKDVKKVKKAKVKVFKEKQTRIEIIKEISDKVEMSKSSVESVFQALVEIINGHMSKKGSGEVIIPMTGIKIRRIQKAKTKSRKMKSPLINKEVVIPAKPARAAVKLVALKSLKDSVA